MRFTSAALTVALIGFAAPAAAQSPSGAVAAVQNETTTLGTVVSATRNTLVVRTPAEEYLLFELTSNTTKPATLEVASGVEVTSYPSEIEGASTAKRVKVTSAAPPLVLIEDGAPAPKAQAEAVPPDLRRLERSIERQTSKYRIGGRAGMALDPELVMLGAQAQLGPVFGNNVWARPNLEFGFGEVTTAVVINLDGVYRLPSAGRWATFFGAGIGLNFSNEGFEGEDDGTRFDFDDFIYDTGINVLAGVQSRSGMFLELRAGVYSEPHLRFVIGYNLW
jgi:hypothetical protein